MVLEDNQKIGIGLICLGLGFIFLGIVLMLDTSLIAIGNTLFIIGLIFIIGIKRSFTFFTRRDRLRGTFFFFLGIALILLRWGLVGIFVEAFGFLNLFGNFLPTVLTVARQIPGLSTLLEIPVVSHFVNFVVGRTRPKYSV